MKIRDLLECLAKRGGEVRAVYTGEGNPEDRYAIVNLGGRWEVFYSERGKQLEAGSFDSEDEACKYLLALLEADETIWRAGTN